MSTCAIPGADIIAWRRHPHAHPELSYQEFRTAAFVEERLRAFGLETAPPTETSVVGVLRGTRPGTGPTVALRADLDALPVHEETGLPFASTSRG